MKTTDRAQKITARAPYTTDDDPTSGIRRVPRMYDSIPDVDGSTVTSDLVCEYARLSDWTAVPKLRFAGDIARLPLDPSAAFLIQQIDGVMPVEAILDGSPFGEEQTLRILSQLIQMKLVTLA